MKSSGRRFGDLLKPDRKLQAGTTTLEFALVGSTFVFLMIMTFELCWQLTTDLALNIGAISASRYGVTGAGYTAGTRDASILAAVLSTSGGILQSSNLTLSDESYATAASYASSGTGTSGSGASGQFVVYTLTYVQPYMTGLPAIILKQASMTHTATVLVQNEPF